MAAPRSAARRTSTTRGWWWPRPGDDAADAAVGELAAARRLFCLPASGAVGGAGPPPARRRWSGRPRRRRSGRSRAAHGDRADGAPGGGRRRHRSAGAARRRWTRSGAAPRSSTCPRLPAVRPPRQDEINALLIAHARAGRTVVRLKGGDGFVFGRGAEEWQACAAAGIDVQIVPGLIVRDGRARPGRHPAHPPSTQPGLQRDHRARPARRPAVDARLRRAGRRSGLALVVLMGVGTLARSPPSSIRHGMDPATPAATIADGTLPTQRVVRASLSASPPRPLRAGIRPPAITVIGSVAGFDPGQSLGSGGCRPACGSRSSPSI